MSRFYNLRRYLTCACFLFCIFSVYFQTIDKEALGFGRRTYVEMDDNSYCTDAVTINVFFFFFYNGCLTFYSSQFHISVPRSNLRHWFGATVLPSFSTQQLSEQSLIWTVLLLFPSRYFSLQATNPLGFDDSVRMEIESNICREGGPLPDCFTTPLQQAWTTMEKVRLS